jgi:hypothetical protein
LFGSGRSFPVRCYRHCRPLSPLLPDGNHLKYSTRAFHLFIVHPISTFRFPIGLYVYVRVIYSPFKNHPQNTASRAKALYTNPTGYATSRRCSLIWSTVTNINDAELVHQRTDRAARISPIYPLQSRDECHKQSSKQQPNSRQLQ